MTTAPSRRFIQQLRGQDRGDAEREPVNDAIRVLGTVLALAGALAACRDEGYATVVVNESDAPLIVEYVPKSSEMSVYSFGIGPNERGGSLGSMSPFDPWEGATVNVMTTDCRAICSEVLTPEAWHEVQLSSEGHIRLT